MRIDTDVEDLINAFKTRHIAFMQSSQSEPMKNTKEIYLVEHFYFNISIGRCVEFITSVNNNNLRLVQWCSWTWHIWLTILLSIISYYRTRMIIRYTYLLQLDTNMNLKINCSCKTSIKIDFHLQENSMDRSSYFNQSKVIHCCVFEKTREQLKVKMFNISSSLNESKKKSTINHHIEWTDDDANDDSI
jgi:hypothetical protein